MNLCASSHACVRTHAVHSAFEDVYTYLTMNIINSYEWVNNVQLRGKIIKIGGRQSFGERRNLNFILSPPCPPKILLFNVQEGGGGGRVVSNTNKLYCNNQYQDAKVLQ